MCHVDLISLCNDVHGFLEMKVLAVLFLVKNKFNVFPHSNITFGLLKQQLQTGKLRE